jgi:hypothetical protein
MRGRSLAIPLEPAPVCVKFRSDNRHAFRGDKPVACTFLLNISPSEQEDRTKIRRQGNETQSLHAVRRTPPTAADLTSHRPAPILTGASSAATGSFPSSGRSRFASGTMKRPSPSRIALPATGSHGVCAMLAAIAMKTLPQTGGVMVQRGAHQ